MPFFQKHSSEGDLRTLNDDLIQSHNELLQIFELSSIGMSVVALDGSWIRVNKYLSDMLGYTQEELLKKTFNDVTHHEDRELGLNKIKESLEGKISTFEIEKRYLHKDGRILYVSINSALIRRLDGSPKYFISQTKDITGSKASMNALALSEEKFRLLFERAPIGIAHFDSAGNITMANKVLADILGSTADKVTSLNTLKNLGNEGQRKAFEEALMGRIGHFEGEFTAVTGGRTSYLRTTCAPLFGIDGNVQGGIAITEDITAGKLQEQKLLTSLEEKELLLKEVYHRVKNNLQTIISLLNIQISESVNEEFIESVKETKNRLYAMSKVHEVLCSTGNFVSILLGDYVNNLVRNFDSPRSNFRVDIKRNVSLSVDQTNSLGIIINELITNSIKHNAEKELVISLQFDVSDGGNLIFNYFDNGKGFVKSENIFSNSLGMNLVSMLVENQLEGTINFLNEPGFHIQIEFKINSVSK